MASLFLFELYGLCMIGKYSGPNHFSCATEANDGSSYCVHAFREHDVLCCRTDPSRRVRFSHPVQDDIQGGFSELWLSFGVWGEIQQAIRCLNLCQTQPHNNKRNANKHCHPEHVVRGARGTCPRGACAIPIGRVRLGSPRRIRSAVCGEIGTDLSNAVSIAYCF